MLHPQVLIHEWDGRLAALLRPTTTEQKWLLREPRQLKACLRLLRRSQASVLVIRVGRSLEREMELLERVAWLHPETALVLVGDSEHAVLAGLAWDLGADFVLTPPQPRERLPEIVVALMGRRNADRAALPG
jgi:hypothetical protein